MQNNDKGCLKVTALAAATEKAAASDSIGCQLWYEGTVRPVTGIFTSSGLLHEEGHGSTLKPYLLTCESKFPSMVPFGLSVTVGRLDGFVHVTVPRLPKDDEPLIQPKLLKKDFVACVGPQETHEDSTQLLTEQVLLQKFFQVENFVVYDAGLTNKFMATIAERQADEPSLHVEVLPWNSPPGLDLKASKMLVKTDCHYRTRNTYNSSTFLNIGQILVARTSTELFLDKLLRRLAPEGAKLDVSVRKFCLEAPLDEGSAAIEYAINAIRKSHYDEAKSAEEPAVSVMYNVRPNSGVKAVSNNDLLVHDYSSCKNYDMDDTTNEKLDDFLVTKAKPIQQSLGKYFSKIQIS